MILRDFHRLSKISDEDMKIVQLVTGSESWIESQFMTGNWANIRNQHNPMIISMIIRTKGIGLKAQYILIARRKREIGLDAKQPRK